MNTTKTKEMQQKNDREATKNDREAMRQKMTEMRKNALREIMYNVVHYS
jgi:GH24 family phage-related lysozyme (muramidase)